MWATEPRRHGAGSHGNKSIFTILGRDTEIAESWARRVLGDFPALSWRREAHGSGTQAADGVTDDDFLDFSVCVRAAACLRPRLRVSISQFEQSPESLPQGP